MSITKDMREATSFAAPLQLHQANAGVRADEYDMRLGVLQSPPEGGTKHDDGKPQLSMVSHELMVAVARVREFGANKYERDNWRKGFKYTRSIDAALRHIMAFKDGEDYDQESKHTHIAHAICCLEHLLHDFCYRPENDDRYKGNE